MSLGASRNRVLGDVLRDGMRLAAGRILAGLLHEVRPGDPGIVAATAGFLAVVTLVACYVPARRAAALDPLRALRHD